MPNLRSKKALGKRTLLVGLSRADEAHEECHDKQRGGTFRPCHGEFACSVGTGRTGRGRKKKKKKRKKKEEKNCLPRNKKNHSTLHNWTGTHFPVGLADRSRHFGQSLSAL